MKTRAEWVLPLGVPSLPSVSGVWGASLPMFDYFTVFHCLCHYSSCNFGVWTPCYLDKRRVLRPSCEFPSGSIGDLYAPFLGKFRINGVWDLKLTHRPSLVDHGWMMVSQANRLNIGQRSLSKVSNVCLKCGYLDAFWGSSIRSICRTIIALRDVIVVWKYVFWGFPKDRGFLIRHWHYLASSAVEDTRIPHSKPVYIYI